MKMSCYHFSNNNNLNSTLTVGQLFDKAVDKVMSDKVLRHNVESNKSSHSWPFGKNQASVGSSMSLRRSTVIQSAPTGGAIWVFLDGDNNEVTLTSNCNTLKNQTRTFNTEKVVDFQKHLEK